MGKVPTFITPLEFTKPSRISFRQKGFWNTEFMKCAPSCSLVLTCFVLLGFSISYLKSIFLSSVDQLMKKI